MMDSEKDWPEKSSALKSPWLWGIILMMTLFFSVNIFMAWTAFNSKPNLVTPDYYKRGQSFTERTKIKNKTKALLNWKIDLTHPEIIIGEPSLFRLSVTSKGNRINPASATFFAYRPSDANKDFQVMMDSNPDGSLTANITFADKGYWDVIIAIEHDGYETDHALKIYAKSP